MKSNVERQLFSVSNEHKRSKSEEVNNSQIRHLSILKQSKSEGEGGPDTISSISKSCSSSISSNQVLSKKTVDLVLLMKSKNDESPLSVNNRLKSWISPSSVVTPDATCPSPISTSTPNSTFGTGQLSSGETKRANSRPANSNNNSAQDSRPDKERRPSSSLFRSKYIAASIIEDLSMACESRDSEEESRIAQLLLKQQNHTRKISAKSLDSFYLDGCQEQSVLKIFFIGDEKVGKSSILRRYCENKYTEEYTPTCGVDFKPDIYRYSENSIFKCQLWDACAMKSAESFHVVTQAYFKSFHVFALVFSVQQRGSFDNVQKWLETVKDYGQPDACVFLVGNKSEVSTAPAPAAASLALGEVTPSREVTFDEAAELGRKWHLPYIETSAATGSNVSLLLEMLMSAAATKVVATSAINKELASDGHTSEEVKSAGTTLSRKRSEPLSLAIPAAADSGGEEVSPLTSASLPSSPFSELNLIPSMRRGSSRATTSHSNHLVEDDSHWMGEEESQHEDYDDDSFDDEEDILYVAFDDDGDGDGDGSFLAGEGDEVKERDSFTATPDAVRVAHSGGKKGRSSSDVASPPSSSSNSKQHKRSNNETTVPMGRCLPGCSLS